MMCTHHPTLQPPALVEEFILNPDYIHEWPGVRRYRLEYGFECSCPEGLLYLPAEVDAQWAEEVLAALWPKPGE